MSIILGLIIFVMVIFPLPIQAEEVNTTYQGEYTLDYLLRNYNVVTFEQNDNPTYDFINNMKKNGINLNIEGPVLINGDYLGDRFEDISLYYSYVNSNNMISHISGRISNNIISSYDKSINKNFIDYKKLYNNILIESNALVNSTEYFINSSDIFIDKPGIYQINNTRINDDGADRAARFYPTHDKETEDAIKTQYIYIDNYNPNDYYVFNNLKTYETDNYYIYIKTSNDTTFSVMQEFIESGKYTGNIIFNYPNARFIINMFQNGKIVAPKADVFFVKAKNRELKTYFESTYANTISNIAIDANYDKTIQTYVLTNNAITIEYIPYSSNKKLKLDKSSINQLKEIVNYEDDIYDGEYSIYEMLKNYNVVSMGLKEYDSNTYYYKNNVANKGNVSLYHIAGQLLVNGDIKVKRLDLESNLRNESFYKNSWVGKDQIFEPGTYNMYKPWGDGLSFGSNSVSYSFNGYSTYTAREIKTQTSYINFERLYDSIVKEQKEIKLGDVVTLTDGIAKVQIGKNYFINDISQINEIVFENFDENESKLTVITILDEEVNFPLVSQTMSGNYVSTKDYFGKEEPMFAYEYYNFPDDIYYGNIIWNLPNAKYIKLAANAPFFGHIVAPNADLEMPETHFAGGVIVNSLYAEGNSEAHFYPLQPVDIPEDYDCFVTNTNFYNGKWYTDETVLVVNPTAKDVLEPPKEEITNPKTGDTYKIVLVLSLAILVSVLTIIFVERKNLLFK